MSVNAARVARFATGVALVVAAPAWSQARLGYVTHLDGAVLQHHRYAPDAARLGNVMVAGDELQTAAGRAEITFPDGSTLHLDEYTRIAVTMPSHFQLIDGRVFMRTSGVSASAGWIAETSAGRVRMFPRGIYGVMTTARHHDAHLRVVVGHARIETRWGVEEVRAHHTAFLSGPTGRPFVSGYAPPMSDGFENWSAARSLLATLGPNSPWPVNEVDRAAPVADEYRESRYDETYVNSYPPNYPFAYGRTYYGRAGRPVGRHHPREDGDRDRNRAGRERGGRGRESGEPSRQATPPRVTASAPSSPPTAAAPSAGVRIPKS